MEFKKSPALAILLIFLNHARLLLVAVASRIGRFVRDHEGREGVARVTARRARLADPCAATKHGEQGRSEENAKGKELS